MWTLGVLDSCQPPPNQQGLLVGCVDLSANKVTVLSCLPVTGSDGPAAAAAAVQDLLPGGVWVLGACNSTGSTPAAAEGVPAVTASVSDGVASWTVAGQQAVPQTVAINSSDLPAPPGFSLARCHCLVHLAVASSSKEAVAAAVTAAEQQVLSASTVYIPDQGWAKAPQCLSSSSSSSSSDGGAAAAAGVLAPAPGCPAISLTPFLATSSSSSRSASAGLPAAPMFEYQPSNSSSAVATGAASSSSAVRLGLDVVAYVPSSTPASKIASQHLTPALRQQLQRISRNLQQQQQQVFSVQCLHFVPPGFTHLVTCCYPHLSADADTSELKLAPLRKQLHEALGLPTNMPLLRAANALQWQLPEGGAGGGGSGAAAAKAGRLQDVHATLPSPQLGGEDHLISGHYDYYHYMQDRFNDSGWGCAYRSLQTIVSWFKLQRYSSKPVPSHRDIQQILVKLGDKDASFVGSSNWIGAIELSYILDDYLGITSKILTVNRGGDIPSYARQLAAHFDTQGTPVMIGGGVLAYTLLGVHFNEATGDCAFLILDPHYTGGEDLKKIQSGTWVAWKRPGQNAAAGGPLFVEDAFYNFLCPQRPNTV